MKTKYWIVAGVVAVLLAAAYFIYRGMNKSTGIEWKFGVVEKGDILNTVTATGSLSAVATLQVGTQVSGTIDRILVDFNDRVRQGQVIAILDTTYLAASMQDAWASFHRNEVQVRQTKREFDRTNLLFEQKVVAEADYDLALTAYETALTNLKSSEAALNRARINLKYATITAPISGIVVSRAVDVGQTVAASFNTPTLFTIANDLTKMQVQASVDEADIGKVAVDQRVTFTVDAYPGQSFNGRISQIRLLPTVVQNVVNYTVIIDVPNPDMKLLPGMTANITIVTDQVTGVLKVPSTALRFRPPQEYITAVMKTLPDSVRQRWERFQQRMSGGQEVARSGGQEGQEDRAGRRWGGEGRPEMSTIWVKSGDNIMPRRVRAGLSDGTYTQILGKVEEGEEVVTGMNSGMASSTQPTNPFAPQMQRGRR